MDWIASEMNTSLPQPRSDNVGVIALVPDQWEPQWQVRHHLLSRLARYFPVVWINYPPRLRQVVPALWRRRNTLVDGAPRGCRSTNRSFGFQDLAVLPGWHDRLRKPSFAERLAGCVPQAAPKWFYISGVPNSLTPLKAYLTISVSTTWTMSIRSRLPR